MEIKNKSVLIVASHFAPNFGGVETHLNDLVPALIRRKWSVFVATYKPLARNVQTPIIEKRRGAVIYRMPWLGFNIVHMLTPYPALEFLYLFPGLFIMSGATLMFHRSIGVIHAQGLVPTVISVIWGRIFNRKVIVSTHNLYFFPKSGIYRNFSRFIFSQADEILCLSKQSEAEMVSIGVPKKKVKPFRYWLNLDLFKKENKLLVRKKLKLEDRFSAFFVGRLIETKGVLVLLETAKRKECKNINFLIGGDGPLAGRIKSFSLKHPNVKYLGYLSQDMVMNYMNASDIVVVPSLVDEGYGRVAMEAISCGRPVLAAKRGGLSEVVSSKVGVLIEPNSTEYAKHLSYFKRNPTKLEKLSKNTRRYALENFSEKNVKRIISAYLDKMIQ